MDRNFPTNNRILGLGLIFFLLAGVFSALLINGELVSVRVAKGEWDAVIDMSPEQNQFAQDNSARMSETLPAARLSNGKLELSGAQGLEEMRRSLFDNASQRADLLGGPVELMLTLPAGSEPVVLNIEARMTTGYQWEVLEAKNYAQSGEATFTMRYRGPGAPAIQTINLKPTGSGDGMVRLVYRRPFSKDEPIRARVNIRAEAGASIDISDPTPVEPSIQDIVNDAAQLAPQFEQPLETVLPASYDSRTQGIVPAVRDQGGCGSCWAFGTVGVMEIAVKKSGGPLTNLSEQFLISCNKEGWSCNGGLTASMYHYNKLGKAQTVIGAVMESAKPYTATNGTCAVAYSHPYKAASWAFLTGYEWTMPTNDQIKNAIMTYGAVTARVCVDNGWYSYSGGVYNPTSNVCGGSINHQIVLVGWNDATQSWILRNSWGTSWGEGGYMRIKYDPAGTKSRVGEGASWIKYSAAPPAVPTLISPAGTITDTTPTYTWTKVPGATQYEYQVVKNGAIVYSKNVGAGACAATNCSNTPVTILNYGAHQWRARALVGGAWKAFSPYKSFTVSALKPKAGFWRNTYEEFYVTPNQSNVDDFATYLYVPGCGSYEITHTPLVPIVNKQFSFTGSFSASGTFDTTTTAHGIDALNSFYIPGCGWVSGGPWFWTASWKNPNQPTMAFQVNDAVAKVDPIPIGVDSNFLHTVEIVKQ